MPDSIDHEALKKVIEQRAKESEEKRSRMKDRAENLFEGLRARLGTETSDAAKKAYVEGYKGYAAKARVAEGIEVGHSTTEERVAAKLKRKPKKKKITARKKRLGSECPSCERPDAKTQKIFISQTHEIRGQNITVRAAVKECNKCGFKWSLGDSTHDAMTIYVKRNNPAARKFKNLLFISGNVWAHLCGTCKDTFCNGSEELTFAKGNEQCACKGCKNGAGYLLKLGPIDGGDMVED